jgi:hypothetical protein
MNVVRSEMYINMSLAKNFGWCGMDTKGVNNPVYGKTWKKTEEQKKRNSEACKKAFSTQEHYKKMSEIRKGKIPKSLEQINELLEKRKKIEQLFRSKPKLKIPYDYIAGNGKPVTYTRAFSEEFYRSFGYICARSLQNVVKDIK